MSCASGDLTASPVPSRTCLVRALETFKALGIDFVSYSEQMDTSTPAGKMVLTVLVAVAELERSLIVERVKAGLRNARAKGKHLGRPRVAVDAARVAVLRSQGLSWAKIGEELGLGEGTVRRTAGASAKIPSETGSITPPRINGPVIASETARNIRFCHTGWLAEP
jgi:DNA invertase Pin-like site-specific DNA recombinase